MEKIKETIEFFEQQEGWDKSEVLSEYIYEILKGKTEFSADELGITDGENEFMNLQDFADNLFDKIIKGVINVLKSA